MAKAKQATVEEKLKALYKLQSIDTQIDKIKILRGELPLEVQDLEDEIAGLQTRVSNINEEIANFDNSIKDREAMITDSKALINKYEEQLKIENLILLIRKLNFKILKFSWLRKESRKPRLP